MNVEELRAQFPILSTQVYGKPLVYLDNAATSQRPSAVGEIAEKMTFTTNANIHRAVHKLANDTTAEYESTRDAVRVYINAAHREEIIFTSGTTASINLVAQCFTQAFIHEGDEIIIAQSEHHSDIVPWQLAAQRAGATIKVLPVDENGRLQVELLPQLLTAKTKITCVAHISNVLGLVNPIKDIVTICHSVGCRVLADGAQGVVHEKVDVQDLDCDFYAFSGHKVYAQTGVGVLYGKKELLDKMPPYMGGGEMIDTVTFEKTTYAPLPAKYEAGTQNFASVPTLKPALALAGLILGDEQLCANQGAIVNFMLAELAKIDGLRLYGVGENKIPLFSFCVDGVHHEDLALILDKMGFAVRSGQMCAEPLMDRFGVTGMLRVSFAPYNTLEEAKAFIAALQRAVDMLK